MGILLLPAALAQSAPPATGLVDTDDGITSPYLPATAILSASISVTPTSTPPIPAAPSCRVLGWAPSRPIV
ncbi:MAG: hypothetical protein ACK5QW_00690 [Cyanobacteriota bacterium]